MERVFRPRSIVVIGVSQRPTNMARRIIANLRRFGYAGAIYAVGRDGGEVQGIPIHGSLDDVPDGLDLAVILTPAAMVLGLVETCGRKGIRRVVVESGGFAEYSPEGALLEKQVVDAARQWDVRIVGPNCISVCDFRHGLALPFVTLDPESIRPGPVSLVAQSGGLLVTFAERLSQAGVGVSKAISIGNKADLNETDYLEWLLGDPDTGIVLLYLESFSDGRRLLDLARGSSKPIIVHKSNVGIASKRIAQSHTAALAGDDRIATAALRQAGMLRAGTIREAIAVCQGLALGPVHGSRLLIISRSGGHAVMVADEADRAGFSLPPIPEQLDARVRELYPADVIAPTNPIDLGTVWNFDLFAQIVRESILMTKPDAVMLVNAYFREETDAVRDLTRAVAGLAEETGIPIAQCLHASGCTPEPITTAVACPVFSEIEEAALGLAASRDWHRWRAVRAVEA